MFYGDQDDGDYDDVVGNQMVGDDDDRDDSEVGVDDLMD